MRISTQSDRAVVRRGLAARDVVNGSMKFLFCLLVLACMAPPVTLMAQTSGTGAITGTVKDASGGIIPGVTVQLTQASTGDMREATTGSNGLYSFRLLAPDTYSVKFSQPGFKTVIRDGITVRVTETSVVDFALEVASQSEVVTVTGDAPLLQTDNPALGRVVDSRQITELPLASRNFTQLTALSSGRRWRCRTARPLEKAHATPLPMGSFNRGTIT